MSADSLHNPYKWYGSQTPPKIFQKIPLKFHDKAVQSNTLLLNLNKINEIFILQSAHKQGNPSFHFHAPGSKRRHTHALKQHRLSQNISPVCFSFVLVIACISSVKAKNERKALVFTQLKISRYKQHFFAIFRPILVN